LRVVIYKVKLFNLFDYLSCRGSRAQLACNFIAY